MCAHLSRLFVWTENEWQAPPTPPSACCADLDRTPARQVLRSACMASSHHVDGVEGSGERGRSAWVRVYATHEEALA